MEGFQKTYGRKPDIEVVSSRKEQDPQIKTEDGRLERSPEVKLFWLTCTKP